MSSTDLFFLRRCLTLACREEGSVSPNPLVGCVIVKNGTIISEGRHKGPGLAHAEADAISRASVARLKGATLYVNLEPCSHTDKRTPPCAQAIAKAGITRVVYPFQDPNPKTKGLSDKIFRDAGIDFSRGLLVRESAVVNRVYLTNITSKRSFVSLKLGTTMDGRIADKSGCSRWITGNDSQRFVHSLRFKSDAVLIGSGTAASDNPQLTIRYGRKRKPVTRIVLSREGRISQSSALAQSAKDHPLIVIGDRVPEKKAAILSRLGIKLITCDPRDWETLLAILFTQHQIGRVLTEGGGEVAGSLVRSGLADEIILIVAPKLLGDAAVPSFRGLDFPLSEAPEFVLFRKRKLGSDFALHYLSRRTACLPDLLKP
ncbi:MAG: bifunctional diaminohydroxyphosphoribosylaminopyrimidine deaminase/5-amino-6-(5-phosphoribosylamino)uracil reductase RibD [Candidatus Wallbacteria bacterium]|nr:bifunctional diaminohydroxyphosphoribosylaminopyrimidine deaminase/5-amino-6-(5-phosphoribosylamino)uracil reductase RibD [Candidatus Wallbacteria bacterium]